MPLRVERTRARKREESPEWWRNERRGRSCLETESYSRHDEQKFRWDLKIIWSPWAWLEVRPGLWLRILTSQASDWQLPQFTQHLPVLRTSPSFRTKLNSRALFERWVFGSSRWIRLDMVTRPLNGRLVSNQMDGMRIEVQFEVEWGALLEEGWDWTVEMWRINES